MKSAFVPEDRSDRVQNRIEMKFPSVQTYLGFNVHEEELVLGS